MKEKWMSIVIFLAVLNLYGLNIPHTFAEDKYLIPGDARKGWQVFSEKGCVQCHSMGGQERVLLAPDLSKSPAVHLSSTGLAAQMWNHAPEMWEKMSAKWIEFKKMSEVEMADLFAFLYFIRYLDEPGSPARGIDLIKEKGCTACHSLGNGKRNIGPDLAMWSGYTNPILWVQLMWNHGLMMKSQIEKESMTWPQLVGTDIADIIAYIRSLKPAKERVYVSPGDPAEGKKRFAQKGCAQCHATEEQGPDIGPNLGVQKKDFPPTIGQFAGLMWNHFPKMIDEMQKMNMRLPSLSVQDIADITAYLFTIRYFDPAGNRTVGKGIFQRKQCNVCHDVRKEAVSQKDRPNLAVLKGRVSPIAMATALWNHGHQMIARMKEKNIKWENITGRELADLMEYLNRGE